MQTKNHKKQTPKESKGHELLIEDLTMLLERAKQFEFHDFESSHAMPKMELSTLLGKIRSLVIDGKYDN